VLVAQTFVPNPENKPEINHKNGNKQDNYYKNLEWCTHLENMRHSFRNGLGSFKEMNNYNTHQRPKTVSQYSLSGDFITSYINCKEASRRTGICARDIHLVASKTEYKPGLVRKQAGHFRWVFTEEANVNY